MKFVRCGQSSSCGLLVATILNAGGGESKFLEIPSYDSTEFEINGTKLEISGRVQVSSTEPPSRASTSRRSYSAVLDLSQDDGNIYSSLREILRHPAAVNNIRTVQVYSALFDQMEAYVNVLEFDWSRHRTFRKIQVDAKRALAVLCVLNRTLTLEELAGPEDPLKDFEGSGPAFSTVSDSLKERILNNSFLRPDYQLESCQTTAHFESVLRKAAKVAQMLNSSAKFRGIRVAPKIFPIVGSFMIDWHRHGDMWKILDWVVVSYYRQLCEVDSEPRVLLKISEDPSNEVSQTQMIKSLFTKYTHYDLGDWTDSLNQMAVAILKTPAIDTSNTLFR